MQLLKKLSKHLKPSKNTRILLKYISAQEAGLEPQLPLTNNGADVTRSFANSNLLKEIKKCVDCNRHPLLTAYYLSRSKAKKQGVCEKHWIELSDSSLGWSSSK